MTTFTRLIRSALQAGARKRHRDYLADIIGGPDTTYRSELIEATSSTGDRVSQHDGFRTISGCTAVSPGFGRRSPSTGTTAQRRGLLGEPQ